MNAEVNCKPLLNSKSCLGNHLQRIVTLKMHPVLAHTASVDPYTVLTKSYVINPASRASYFSLHWFLKLNASIGRLLRHILSYRVNYVYRG
jgi:hypothetical protein